MTPHETLVKMRPLLADHWTQSGNAIDINGKRCQTDAPEAVSFCWLGACAKVTNTRGVYRGAETVALMRQHIFNRGRGSSLVDFNDSSTHAEVLAMHDELIEETRDENT